MRSFSSALPAALVFFLASMATGDDGSVVPGSDPREAHPPKLVTEVMDTHPRLLFGPEDILPLRRLARGKGKVFFQEMVRYLPSCKAPAKPGFLRDATDGQRIGLWRMPTVALHALLTGDKTSRQRSIGYMKMLLDLEHWETGRERDSGMSSANVLIGAALSYDWLYHELEAGFREKFRAKLLHMARAQYYGGHLNRNKALAYWQGDPANNHRWHRDAGMVLAALVAHEGDAGEHWLLARCFEEMAYVNRWLPADGTSHEGPSYLIFGGAHLTLACQAADRCFGTEYLKGSFFRNAPRFRLHTVAPGLGRSLQFGDSSGMGSYSNFLYKCAAVHRLADVQEGLEQLHAKNPKAWWLGWMSLVWFDPDLDGGSLDRLPRQAFFPDLGLATFRDRWKSGGVAATFKCGPFGGHRLNEYRNANNRKYVNVAHDDPDAASFTIFAGGALLAETDRYSRSKKSANHNTILVNGVGQTVRGRKEGGVWTQPGRGDDMSKMAVITAWKAADGVALVQGEAGGSYPAIRGVRPGLDRFRRTMVWVEGKYVLVLDEIRADEPVEIDWLVQGPQLTSAKGDLRYVLGQGEARCPVAVRCQTPAQARIVTGPADHRGKALGWKQLRLRTKSGQTRLASVYDPWNVGVSLEVDFAQGQTAAATIRGPGFDDRWTWSPAAKRFGAAPVSGRRGDKTLITIDAGHEPPQP